MGFVVAFKNARAMAFPKLGGRAKLFDRVPKMSISFFLGGGGLPLPVATSHKKLIRGDLTSAQIH